MERIKKHIEDAMSNLRAALEGVEAGIEDDTQGEYVNVACLDDAIQATHRAKLLIMLYGKYEVDGGAIIVSTPQDVALGGGL